RSVRSEAAVAGPKESANVISGNQALRKPAPSARTAKSIASGAGSAVRNKPRPLPSATTQRSRIDTTPVKTPRVVSQRGPSLERSILSSSGDVSRNRLRHGPRFLGSANGLGRPSGDRICARTHVRPQLACTLSQFAPSRLSAVYEQPGHASGQPSTVGPNVKW